MKNTEQTNNENSSGIRKAKTRQNYLSVIAVVFRYQMGAICNKYLTYPLFEYEICYSFDIWRYVHTR